MAQAKVYHARKKVHNERDWKRLVWLKIEIDPLIHFEVMKSDVTSNEWDKLLQTSLFFNNYLLTGAGILPSTVGWMFSLCFRCCTPSSTCPSRGLPFIFVEVEPEARHTSNLTLIPDRKPNYICLFRPFVWYPFTPVGRGKSEHLTFDSYFWKSTELPKLFRTSRHSPWKLSEEKHENEGLFRQPGTPHYDKPCGNTATWRFGTGKLWPFGMWPFES